MVPEHLRLGTWDLLCGWTWTRTTPGVFARTLRRPLTCAAIAICKRPLEFVRIEPYVVPKRSLTGENIERVDTRVLRIIHSFDAGRLPVYVGRLMDVFIEAPPVGGATATSAGRAADAP